MTHFGQGNGMDGHHQRVVVLVLLDHLQDTGFVAVAAVEGIAQEQQHRFVTGKLSCLIHRMTEAALLTLVDIMQVLPDIEDARLLLLGLGIEFAQVLLRERALEIVGILLALLLGTQHETDLLDTALDEFLEQDENHRTNHTVGTGDGKKVLLQGTGGRIETGAEAGYGDDGLADGMHGLQSQRIGLQTLLIQVIDQLLLGLGTACQELHRTIAMGTDTLTAPHQGLDLRILQDTMELRGIESLGHRCHLGIKERLGLGHQTP